MLTLDLSKLNGFLPQDYLSSREDALREAARMLAEHNGPGGDFTGWVTLPRDYDKEEFARIQAAAKRIQQQSQVLVVIGIGGSYLGARAVIELLGSPNYNLKQKNTPDILFAGNGLSTDALLETISLIGDRDFSVNVISKSGTTTEPAVAFRIFKQMLEEKYGKEGARERIYATTDKARGVPDVVLALIIYIMACYMLTVDYPYLRSQAVQHTHQRLLHFLKQVRDTALAAFGGYLRAEFLLSVVVFFILLVGFFVIGQPYGLLLALVLAVMDFIPIIGAGTVMVPWAVVDLFMGNYFHAVQLMVIWGAIALFRRVGEPKFVGDQTGLSPIASLISIYIGWRLAGGLGMILGATIALIALNLIRLGIFEGVRLDLAAAAEDIMAVLRERPPRKEE